MHRFGVVLVLSLLAVSGCGGDGDDGGGDAAVSETVTLSARDFAFEPEDVTLDAAGTYTFRVTNEGDAPHALEIEGGDVEEETDIIQPGESGELTIDLAEGEYVLYCPVGDHRERGMEGRLVVAAGAASDGASDSGTGGGSDDGY